MFVEFPADHIYRGARGLFFELMSDGITPIITHPERNSVFGRHPELLYDLVAQGALVQANGGSLTGIYGTRAGAAVLRFMELNLVHFIASDGHDAQSNPPRLAEAARKTAALAGNEVSVALVRHNPRAVLEDREIPYLPEPKDPRKSRRSLWIRIPNFLRRIK
jgi:protein-tyrosine phosphatase